MKRIIILITALLISSQAQAIRISSAGDSFTVDWRKHMSRLDSHTNILTATSTWLVSSYSSNRIIFDISVTNTTAPATGKMAHAGIASFGFGMPDDATGSTLRSGSFFKSLYPGRGMLMVYPNRDNKKLEPGATDWLQLHLTGNFGNAVNLDRFRMNSKANNRNFTMPGKAAKTIRPAGCLDSDSVSDNCTPADIPEPDVAVLVLLGLAMIAGTGTLRRRKRQTATLTV